MMETVGMVRIFQRSLSHRSVRYTSYIGDGDSKTFSSITSSNQYEEDITVSKIECVGHVQKRMGTRLQKLKQMSSKLSDGKSIGGKGRLTDRMIDLITTYYGNAIRQNKTCLSDMRKAVWAVYFHIRSSDEEPLHSFCPVGPNSWCKYQNQVVEGSVETFRHSKKLPVAVMDAIKPVFNDLSQPKLLQKCLGGPACQVGTVQEHGGPIMVCGVWDIWPDHRDENCRLVEAPCGCQVDRSSLPLEIVGSVDTRRYPLAENCVWSDEEDHEERSKDRAARTCGPHSDSFNDTSRRRRSNCSTFSRHLAEANLKSKRPFHALPLTPEHRQLRLQWCKARSMRNVTDRQKGVFSDESRFVLGTNDNRVWVWRRPGERYNSRHTVLRHTARTAGVMVWRAIVYDSRSTLIVMRGTLTGQRYVDDILQPHVGLFLNGLPWAIFQQDNARQHTGRVTQDFLRHFQSFPWAARFPDLSPVEHVWDQLKRQIPSSHSLHDIELAVQDLWAHLPQDNIRCLINSMLNRVTACIAAGGGPTLY
ncbi:transposable element Tcb2 transposase [Trichonephila clavipes]|nr:transposable element Tcb2 transposase [Trichonephila clavipes]